MDHTTGIGIRNIKKSVTIDMGTAISQPSNAAKR